ncbi:alpha/beta hydrolase [Rhodococcus sp. NPDC019627]|uniref:alpha/beta hydrolase n=1 Tax=unclassified Rhodococcus (in: high G+C Gram-positive bacteria) TaxID=192944 RepID=UPI0033D6C8DE
MSTTVPDALKESYTAISARMAANPEMDIATLRNMLDSLESLAAEPTDVTYEDVDAGGVPAILATPNGASKDHILVYAHGGGCVTGSAASHRKVAAHVAKAAGVRAIIPNFRLAPEFPFPAQIDDLIAVHRWLRANGYRPENTVTAGDSAGGNLSITTVLKLRELGEPLPAAIMGFSPWLDMENLGKTMESNADSEALVSREVSELMASLYLGDTARTEPLANPLHADLAGLPPVFVSAGDAETLQDNAERFHDKARAAGVDVTLEIQRGQQHVYLFMAGKSEEADTTIANAGRWLRERLGLKS